MNAEWKVTDMNADKILSIMGTWSSRWTKERMNIIWTKWDDLHRESMEHPELPSIYDTNALEQVVAEFLTQLLSVMDEHIACMFKDCGTIAHRDHWIHRFSIPHNQELHTINCPECGRPHAPWKNRHSVANHKFKPNKVLVCSRTYSSQPKDLSFPFALFWIDWPETFETCDLDSTVHNMAREILDECKTTGPGTTCASIDELARNALQLNYANILLNEHTKQSIAANQSLRYRLSAEHLPSNDEGDKYYRVYRVDGDRELTQAPRCEDVMKTLGILRCALELARNNPATTGAQ
jgi:hypothetical protein